MTFFKDVPKILYTLRHCSTKSNGYMAVASRTSYYEEAKQLMTLYEWVNNFDSLQMYGGSKVRHISKICQELQVNQYLLLILNLF